MDFTSLNIRHIYGAQRYCGKVRICCQYKVTIDSTISRDYVCDNNLTVLSLRQQKTAQARPVFHPDSNIYTEDSPPFNQGGVGAGSGNPSDTSTTGGNVLSCPSIKCWELISESVGESISYYADCSGAELSPCPDATVILTPPTSPDDIITERSEWVEVSYSKNETADNFGKVIQESRQCTKFYYDKSKSKIYIAGPLITINKTRQYNETVTQTYIYEECDNQGSD